MKNFIWIVFSILLLPACNNLSGKEKQLKENINKIIDCSFFNTVQKDNTLILFEEFRSNHKYFSIVYLQNTCLPCHPKFIEWQHKIDSIDTPDDYTVLFVIKGDSYGEFMTNVLDIEFVEDKFYTIMDTEGKFLENNKDIPRWIIDGSVLIDGENKIKMVGEPFATPEMTELFYTICKQ